MENNEPVKHDDDNCRCPACDSSKTIEIPDEERLMGVGLYAVHDFIGQLYNNFHYRCGVCGYRWGKY